MDVLHFIKYFKEGFERYFQKMAANDSFILFDLEDSIRDVHCVPAGSLHPDFRIFRT